MNSVRVLMAPLAMVSLLTVVSAEVGDWNQYRGPAGDGKSTVKNLPLEFDETKNVRWKTPIHGQGWSSPVVWGDQVWLTTGNDESEELFAVCVDLESGDIVHNIKVFDFIDTPAIEFAGRPEVSPNSPASPTPVVEDGRVYVHFGAQGTACLDTNSGEKIWERRDLQCDHVIRAGSSPIVDGDSLYVAYDGVDKQFFVALNKRTGETRWQRERNVLSNWDNLLREAGYDPEKINKNKPGDNLKSYATATIIEHQGRRQLIAPAAGALISYDPETGEEFWRVHHPGGFNVACRPLFENGLIYITTSGLTGHLLGVRPDGSGDVTDTHIAWTTTRGTPEFPSPVIVDGLMFLVTNEGVARCLEATTGEEVWKARLGGNYWASPVYADGRIYFFSKEGKVSVIAATDKFELLGRSQFDNDGFIASPALAGDEMLLRSETDLYCIAEGYEAVGKRKRKGSKK